MPALRASSEVLGLAMSNNSHHANFSSSDLIRMVRNDPRSASLYHANMARKSAKPKGLGPEQPNWYLREWMKTLRVTQAKLARACDWTNSTMHGIYHGRTDYYREIVNLIASKLHIEPYELLMHPDMAMAIRKAQEVAVTLAHDSGSAGTQRKPAFRVAKTGTDGP